MPNLQRQQQQQDRTRHPVRHLCGPPDADAKQMEQEAMTPTQRAAMEQALEFMEYHSKYWNGTGEHPTAVVTALRAALAEQPAEQGPVAWMNDECDVELSHKPWMSSVWLPLYTTPPPAKRVPLTDDEIDALELPPSGTATVRDLVRLIERAHGINVPQARGEQE